MLWEDAVEHIVLKGHGFIRAVRAFQNAGLSAPEVFDNSLAAGKNACNSRSSVAKGVGIFPGEKE